MKQKKNIIFAVFAVLFFCSVFLNARKAEAASVQWQDHEVKEEKRIVTGIDSLMTYWIETYNYDTGTTFKLSNIKSSNKKVVRITTDGDSVTVIPTGKTGTAKITYKLTDPKTKKSKTFTLVKCTYIKFGKMFSSFKVGSKNLLNSVNNYNNMNAPYFGTSSTKKKLTVKAASGYKILSITYNGKTLKSGKSYKFNKSGQIEVEIQHKKTKATGTAYIYVG